MSMDDKSKDPVVGTHQSCKRFFETECNRFLDMLLPHSADIEERYGCEMPNSLPKDKLQYFHFLTKQS